MTENDGQLDTRGISLQVWVFLICKARYGKTGSTARELEEWAYTGKRAWYSLIKTSILSLLNAVWWPVKF